MVRLMRGIEAIEVPGLLWEACQVYARQAGWEPEGAYDRATRTRSRAYTAGYWVGSNDAAALAAALERVVNGTAGDAGELDLGAIVGIVNFLRRGTFAIR
jgi:hypothetical protein